MQTEPVWTVGVLTSLVSAAVALLVAFGVDFTEAQMTAILGAAAVLAPLAVAAIARGRVTSPATLRAMTARSHEPPV